MSTSVTVQESAANDGRSRSGNGARPSAVFFAEYFPPYMGSDRRILDIARCIDGWHIEFAVTPPLRILGGRHEDALREYFKRHFIDGIVEDEAGGFHGHYFLLPEMLMSMWRRVPMPIAYAVTLPYLITRAVQYLREKRPDLVVVAHPSYLCGLVGLFAARLAGLPVLLDYPDAWTPLAIETADISPTGATARVLAVLERIAARSADRIVSITSGLTGYIRKLGARQDVDIVANGADHSRFNTSTDAIREELGLSPNDKVILYAGRLEMWSGVTELVETIRVVAQADERAHFLFVGDGSAAREFRAEAAAVGLSDRVTFVGFQPFWRMPRIIASVDVAIVPFPHTPTTEFCSPVKLFEYMLMGKAVITTDLPGIRESVGEDHVMFVDDLSSDQLSRAIVELLRDDERREALAKSGIEHCLRYHTYEMLAAQFRESMERVLELAPAARR